MADSTQEATSVKPSILTRRFGDRRWDVFLLSTGVVALIAIPVAIYVVSAAPLIFLGIVAIPANGPLSPILPTLFEPIIMEAAKYSGAWSVTLVSLVVYLYTEYLNWHIYRWVLTRERLANFTKRPWVMRTVKFFGHSPFVTVIVFAFTPLPFWTVRILAILDNYSVRRFLVATAIGRAPRFFLYAWLGSSLQIPTWILVVVAVGGAATVIILRLSTGKRLLSDGVLEH